MSHEPSSDRKRKPVEEPDVAINSDDQIPMKSKAPRLSVNSSMTLSHIASLPRKAPMATEKAATANNPSASNAPEQKSSMGRIEKKIQDLSSSDIVEINDALVALSMDLKNDSTTRDIFFTVGGCRALVQLLKNCLEKAIDEITACDKVTELNELAELDTIHKTLRIIANLTFRHNGILVEIASVGGVEAAVKVMETFPKCQRLQEYACNVLINLAYCNIGETKAIEAGGIQVLLAAIDNHLGSAEVCGYACWALFNIVFDNKENTELLISLGGEAAVSKVRTKLPDLEEDHQEVLLDLITEMTASQTTVKHSCKSSEVAIASLETTAVSSLPTATKVATGSLKVPALSFQPRVDTTASPAVPTLSSQSTLIGIYHESSDSVSPSPKVPAFPAKSRNDSQLKPEATPKVVSQQPRNDRKCKSTEAPEIAVLKSPEVVVLEAPEAVVLEAPEAVVLESRGEDELNATQFAIRSTRSLRERMYQKARKDDSTSTVASPQMNAQVATERIATANDPSASNNPEQEASMEKIRENIQDLSGSDNVEVNTALVDLLLDLKKDPTTRDNESIMSHEPSSDRKRKPVEETDVAINSDDQIPMKSNKTGRVTLDSSMTLSHIASLPRKAPMATEKAATANNPSASNAPEQKASMARIEKKIQDLSGSDNVEINDALVALSMDLKNDSTTCDDFFTAGGCRALVQLLKNCLEKAIDEIPACDQVTKLNELAELETLYKALSVIIGLTFQHDESRVAIAAIGGVEVVVEVMKTFPTCETLQECACCALRNLAYCSIGKTNAIESGRIKVLLAAIDNHLLGSANVCKSACWALFNIVRGNKETIELWISLDGRATVSKVRSKWPEVDEVYQGVLRQLTALLEVTPEVVSEQSRNDRKCKPTESLEAVVLESPEAVVAKTASAITEDEEYIQSVGKMIQDLCHSDNDEVNAAVWALNQDLDKDTNKCDKIQAVGGCLAMVQLLKNCLEKAIDEIPACDQVTELNELAGLETIHRALHVINRLTHQHGKRKIGIATIGGVEVVVKVMKTFPKCQALQKNACGALCSLACCSIGKTKAIESCGIEVLLASVTNHLGSAYICKTACSALFNIVSGNKENAALLITLGGRAAVSKVRSKWPDIDETHQGVLRRLAEWMTAFQPTVRSSCKSSEVAIASLKVPAFSSQHTVPKVAAGSLKIPAVSFQPTTAAKDTTTCPVVSTLSSQSTLIGIYHEFSDGASPSPKVLAVPSTPRNDSQLPEATPEVVSEQSRNDRKYKPTESPEAVVVESPEIVVLESTGEDERNATKVVTRSSRRLRERKFRDGRTDASTSTVASLEMNAQVLTERDSTAASVVSTSNTEQEGCTSNAEPQDQIQSIGTLIQGLFYSDNITFNAALRALIFSNLLCFFLHALRVPALLLSNLLCFVLHVLRVYLLEDSRKWNHVISVGGCFAVVPIIWLVVKEMIR
jgi:sirohydrochlorin ferrochelatase